MAKCSGGLHIFLCFGYFPHNGSISEQTVNRALIVHITLWNSAVTKKNINFHFCHVPKVSIGFKSYLIFLLLDDCMESEEFSWKSGCYKKTVGDQLDVYIISGQMLGNTASLYLIYLISNIKGAYISHLHIKYELEAFRNLRHICKHISQWDFFCRWLLTSEYSENFITQYLPVKKEQICNQDFIVCHHDLSFQVTMSLFLFKTPPPSPDDVLQICHITN